VLEVGAITLIAKGAEFRKITMSIVFLTSWHCDL